MTAPGKRNRLPSNVEIDVALERLGDNSSPPPVSSGSFAHVSSVSGSIPIQQDEYVKLPFSFGDVISGKYEIVGLIGAGGVGFVVSAMHLELGEMVALKFLREQSLAYPEVVERFAREARAAARIKSEYVARVFDVGSLPNGMPFIVMEYLHGKDLADVVREKGRLPVKLAVEHIMQACEALASAHAIGIVHRDIKPENLFLTQHAEGMELIKVLDFGISKVALNGGLQQRQFAKTQMPMGTPAYMSPEQIRSTGDVDARTDIWALGCVLFELLTGACVFDAPTLMQLSAAILERDPIPLRKLMQDATPELEAVVLRCLEKDPNKRFQSVAELAIALYPFGPRRSRISAERCSYILKGGGEPLELTSVSPPALNDTPVSARAPISSNASTQSPAPAVVTAEEMRAMRPGSRRYGVAVVGLIAVAAGAFFALRPKADTTAAAPAPVLILPQQATELPAAAAKAPSATAAAAAATTVRAEAPNAEGTASSAKTASSRAASAPRSYGVARPAAPRGKAPTVGGSRSVRADDDDVGY